MNDVRTKGIDAVSRFELRAAGVVAQAERGAWRASRAARPRDKSTSLARLASAVDDSVCHKVTRVRRVSLYMM